MPLICIFLNISANAQGYIDMFIGTFDCQVYQNDGTNTNIFTGIITTTKHETDTTLFYLTDTFGPVSGTQIGFIDSTFHQTWFGNCNAVSCGRIYMSDSIYAYDYSGSIESKYYGKRRPTGSKELNTFNFKIKYSASTYDLTVFILDYKKVKIRLISSNGTTLFYEPMNDVNFNKNIENLASGLYILSLEDEKGNCFKYKIVR